MHKLWVRLALAFLAVTLLAVSVVALLVQGATESSFRAYINRSSVDSPELVAALEAYYAEHGSWAGAEAALPARGGAGNGRGQGAGRGGAQLLVADMAGQVQAATDAALLGQPLDAAALAAATPLMADGAQVGWLVQQTPGGQVLGEAETQFLNETSAWLGLTAIGGGALALLLGLGLAWQLTRPLRRLTEATQALAAGGLGHQVVVGGSAEIAALAESFNGMSQALAEGEVLRQRMAADVAHELRTPVSVLRGHLEAMLDGVFPLDGEHVAVAYDQTLHLTRLVEDLRLLTQAESGRLPLEKASVAPAELVHKAIERFAPLALDAQVALSADVAPGLPQVLVDVDRIQQVLANLLANALRHTLPEGRITLAVQPVGARISFVVENSGGGLTLEQAAHVFERFWRAEDARERDSGGSGLGLAITRQLVLLHGGSIRAEVGDGLTRFIFDLPAVQGQP